jgi:hypothetical protein
MKTAKIKDTNYLIYDDGTLLNTLTGKFKKWSKDSNGYIRCTIWINGKSKTISQHRILAEYFIDNPESKLQVNHKNGIKHDNRLDNLEWVTQSENALHSFANGLQKPTRPHMKKVVNVQSGKIYDCISDAAKDNKLNISYLNLMLNGKKNNTSKLKIYETD